MNNSIEKTDYAEICEKIKNSDVVVVTAEDMINIVENKGAKVAMNKY